MSSEKLSLEQLIENAIYVAEKAGVGTRGKDMVWHNTYDDRKVFINYVVDQNGLKHLTIEKAPDYNVILNIRELYETQPLMNSDKFVGTKYGNFRILYYEPNKDIYDYIENIRKRL